MLQLTVRPAFFAGSIIFFAILVVVARVRLPFDFSDAIFFALIAVALHWLAALLHQLGHALAARSTGFPMNGIRFGYFGLLAASRYPRDEPQLPARVHIRRALGGPLASAFVSLVAGAMAFAFPLAGIFATLAQFFFWDNLLVFALGSLAPLGFTDGSTLLQWRNKK